jgi:ubiquinone/menaquinone biosynthesis C-methylase UbiE
MRVSALEGHRLWASTYDADANPLLALENRVMRHLFYPTELNLFIDVACGTGRWMSYLRQRGGIVFGVDLCGEMLAQAKQKHTLRQCLVLGDAGNLPFATGIANVSFCSFAAAYLSDLRKSVGEMARVTAHGGKVILSDLHPARISEGWTRSFRLGASVYEMEHLNTSIEEFVSAADESGLRLQMQFESSFGEQERPAFRTAGKEQLFERLANVPAVWIGVWKKP